MSVIVHERGRERKREREGERDHHESMPRLIIERDGVLEAKIFTGPPSPPTPQP